MVLFTLAQKDKLVLSQCLFAAGVLCTLKLTNNLMNTYGLSSPLPVEKQHNSIRKDNKHLALDTSYHQSLRRFIRTTELGKYNLGAELGAGATAIVLQATAADKANKSNRTTVDTATSDGDGSDEAAEFAIKVLNKQTSPSSEAQTRNEINILRLCSKHSHPNIIHLVDHKETVDHFMIISQRFGTESLQDRLQRCGPLSETAARHLFRQLGAALSFLHATLNIVHRDVKPANLLLGEDTSVENNGSSSKCRLAHNTCQLKLCDLGSAQEMTGEYPDGQATGGVGSIAYAAPEVWSGSAYGHTVDWYSAGVVLSRLVSNKLPFRHISMDFRKARECWFPGSSSSSSPTGTTATNQRKSNTGSSGNVWGGLENRSKKAEAEKQKQKLNFRSMRKGCTTVSSTSDLVLSKKKTKQRSYGGNRSTSGHFEGSWQHASPEVIDLIRRLVHNSPKERPHAGEVMGNKWLVAEAL